MTNGPSCPDLPDSSSHRRNLSAPMHKLPVIARQGSITSGKSLVVDKGAVAANPTSADAPLALYGEPPELATATANRGRLQQTTLLQPTAQCPNDFTLCLAPRGHWRASLHLHLGTIRRQFQHVNLSVPAPRTGLHVVGADHHKMARQRPLSGQIPQATPHRQGTSFRASGSHDRGQGGGPVGP